MTALADPFAERLRAEVAPGGGWPYYPGRGPRLEPTIWALLALGGDPVESDQPMLDAGARFVWRHLAGDGLLRDPGAPAPNLAWNGLALLVGTALWPADSRLPRLAGAVASSRGERLDDAPGVTEQNNQIQAWAWIPGTFSWVEPTACCLLALKQQARRGGVDRTARIADGDAMLLDRVCPHGGWNYGNSSMLGQDLRPYVATTAMALLALQDRADAPAVPLSLDWLAREARSERAAMSLSLAAICLAVYRRPFGYVLDALTAQHRLTGALGNLHLAAMASAAASLDRHDARAFRLGPPTRGAR